MKSLKVLTVVLVCLALSSIALAEMPKKCTYEAGVVGGVILGEEKYASFLLAEDITITVLEEITVPLRGGGEVQAYRFSADYDKLSTHCPQHGSHTWEENKRGIPEELWDQFFFAAEDGSCTAE